ncbi:MAG TPA: hypothetical protein VJ867_07700 [Gemmatimonadaceae bacterium]|nr:hypothetical protein [Gemmatimonadaceae bacterium]
MSARSMWRRESLSDFADVIRGELGEMRVPAADAGLLARIHASRANGSRVILPTVDAPRRRPAILLVASAIVAALLAVVAIDRLTLSRAVVLPASSSWLVNDVAYATAVPQAGRYPAARITHAERLRPLSLVYDGTFRDVTGNVSRSESRLLVTRDSLRGQRVWRLVATRRRATGAIQVDSVWVAAATLAPLQQTITEAPYSRYDRITVHQRFDGLRVRGDMSAFRGGAVDAHRTFDRRLPPEAAPYIADAFAPIFHMGVALDRAWKAHASLLGWAVRDDNVFVAVGLRVDGEDSVRVPAGTFASWRLAIESGPRVRWYWVRKSDGVGVRMLDSTSMSGVREIVLRSEGSSR